MQSSSSPSNKMSAAAAPAAKPLIAFDFDGTLVRPREGRTFPKDRGDWRWLRQSVPTKLRELASAGSRILIVTDQSKDWKEDMIRDVIAEIGVPIELLVHRTTKKPDTSQIVAAGWTPSFYVGDAGGRAGDWSDCDKVFAERLGIPYYTPEEFFPPDAPIARTLPRGPSNEVVVMVGYPASGKSTLARELATHSGYVHIDGDLFTTPASMLREARKAPATAGIVFDSTGGTLARRATFLDWARASGRPARIVWVNTDIDTAMNWNALRAAAAATKAIPAVAFYTFRKRFEPPTEAEAPVLVLE
jgi:bifunctional polynucleotide phosphatase/kinase